MADLFGWNKELMHCTSSLVFVILLISRPGRGGGKGMVGSGYNAPGENG